jgi:hypothetical protein
MHVTHSSTGTIHIALTIEEAAAVRDDIGQLWASQISAAGDQLHGLLVSATEDEPTRPAPRKQETTAGSPASVEPCPEPSYGGYLAHKRRREDACDGCKEAKRAYDRERYRKDPRRARAPQRAYEARKRAAAAVQAVAA